jgi:hypothetical protein
LRFYRGLKSAQSAATSPLMLTVMTAAFAALALASASGCGRTVLVAQGSPIRIGPKTQAQIYTRIDGEWILSQNRVVIPEGWYVVPPDYVDESK